MNTPSGSVECDELVAQGVELLHPPGRPGRPVDADYRQRMHPDDVLRALGNIVI